MLVYYIILTCIIFLGVSIFIADYLYARADNYNEGYQEGYQEGYTFDEYSAIPKIKPIPPIPPIKRVGLESFMDGWKRGFNDGLKKKGGEK